jgi:hypothetical protein
MSREQRGAPSMPLTQQQTPAGLGALPTRSNKHRKEGKDAKTQATREALQKSQQKVLLDAMLDVQQNELCVPSPPCA